MTDASRVSRRCTFGDAIDVMETLEELPGECLPVDETRVLILYRDAILDIESETGPLSAGPDITVTVFEPPPSIEPEADPEEIGTFVERFADRLADRAGTTVRVSVDE